MRYNLARHNGVVTHDDLPGPSLDDSPELRSGLRRTVLLVALLNLGYFFVEGIVALAIGSVSLFADSVDFFEDFAVNSLIALALGWSLSRRAVAGKVMAGIILLPALAAVWQAVSKFRNPEPPQVLSLLVTAGGAIAVNLLCTWVLTRWRHHGGSMTAAAFLAARNDVIANLAIIAMGGLTWATRSGWPDIALGLFIVALNVTAAREVWEVAESETLAARALAGEEIDDD